MIPVRTIAAILFMVAPLAANAENCPLSNLSERQYDDLECQFYLGTTAYRAGVYEVAAAHWQRIIDAEADSPGAGDLKSTARSTVAYLKYNGLGIERDRQGAVDDWLAAVSDGEPEARLQLGFAYSDTAYAGYDPVTALAWYRSLQLVYPNPEALDDTDQAIYQQAVDGAVELETVLSAEQIARARETAQSLIQ